ncbi:MAG: response regulator transcription factor [Bacteroidota bacterium]
MKDVIVADDHPMIVAGLMDIVQGSGRYRVVATFSNGTDALEFISSGYEGIAILDINMGDVSGLEISRHVHQNAISLQIIILTLFDDPEFLLEAIDYGVQGYLSKENTAEELLNCIDQVGEGKRYISQSFFESHKDISSDIESIFQVRERIAALSQRELNVISLISQGMSSTQIADTLFLSPKTIENHRGNICKKLNITGHNSLTKWVAEHKRMIEYTS